MWRGTLTKEEGKYLQWLTDMSESLRPGSPLHSAFEECISTLVNFQESSFEDKVDALSTLKPYLEHEDFKLHVVKGKQECAERAWYTLWAVWSSQLHTHATFVKEALNKAEVIQTAYSKK